MHVCVKTAEIESGNLADATLWCASSNAAAPLCSLGPLAHMDGNPRRFSRRRVWGRGVQPVPASPQRAQLVMSENLMSNLSPSLGDR